MPKEIEMQGMKLFIDTHDHRSGTFPSGIDTAGFGEFFAHFDGCCSQEGVVILRAHVGLADGRAYCFTMAPSADHVRRAHERAGLPFETITEVSTVTPGDLFFERSA